MPQPIGQLPQLISAAALATVAKLRAPCPSRLLVTATYQPPTRFRVALRPVDVLERAVTAPGDGQVVEVSTNQGHYGVTIDHGDRVVSYLRAVITTTLVVGVRVSRGDLIGYLHGDDIFWETGYSGDRCDPLALNIFLTPRGGYVDAGPDNLPTDARWFSLFPPAVDVDGVTLFAPRRAGFQPC
jgi:hypothetical protein